MTGVWVLTTGRTLATLYTALLTHLCCTMKPGLGLEVKEQVVAVETDMCAEGRGGRGEGFTVRTVGERGRVAVKNNWTLWCCSMWEGSALRHLGSMV